jgi:hypothetical protein
VAREEHPDPLGDIRHRVAPQQPGSGRDRHQHGEDK